MPLDMTDTIEPRSDQMNADDLMTGPRTFTISRVRRASAPDQPVDVYLAEFPEGRPFKPSKSMRRVMVAAWGADADAYVGKRLTLFRDSEITFGKDKVGGVRISHMSHLEHGKALRIALTVTRGKRSPYVVEPLPDATPPTPVVSAETLAELTALFRRKGVPEEKWLPGVNHYTRGAATSLDVITEDQAHVMLAELATRPDVGSTPPAGESDEQCPLCGGIGHQHDDELHAAAGR